ncbi:TIGR02206 family membrane protein [Pyxidicoccus fallax]|uniref:TIGR02206 family membrane protein n=1 Tax=Pyxidicoccus fallax TaxID=394095 RepID=A0A848LTD7_9BACT|nr:TIGR02206 family membrane protein [Pyxidicoccus fallax]NMO20939.1 TIGR02206 family membrane protein [Pyxidicoccus fallax]NPC78034.1 TIGR02206 family membrane protein [Pyxidicoccus fallax]
MRPFVLFGASHLAALLVISLTAVGLVWLVRRHPATATPTRYGLALALVGLAVAVLVLERRAGTSWAYLAPLHLCDAAILLGVWALLTRHRLAIEILYFWACAGTVLALLTPDLGHDFPHPHFLSYFSLHGAVVVAALLLVAGLGYGPRPGAVWRALLWTHVYAVAVGVVNVAFGTNFLYLCAKPLAPTPLDWFGPWPVYLLVGSFVALGLFTLLALPFRRKAGPGRGPSA